MSPRKKNLAVVFLAIVAFFAVLRLLPPPLPQPTQARADTSSGPATQGTTMTPANVWPVLTGGLDVNNKVQIQQFDVSSWLSVALQTGYSLDHPTPSGVLTSNGTTNVAIVAAGGAGIRNYVISLSAVNNNASTVHTFDLKSGTTILGEWKIQPNGGGLTIDSNGAYQTATATALNFAIDSGGAGSDVTVTALTIAK